MADMTITKVGSKCYIESTSVVGIKWIITNIDPKNRDWIKAHAQIVIDAEFMEDFISELQKEDIEIDVR